MSLLPSAQSPRDAEKQIVYTQPATSHDLNLYRFGSYNHTHNTVTRRVPIPHPANQHYSSVAVAQRRQTQETEWWRNKRQQLHDEDIQKQKWIRPMEESSFQIFRPNIQNFNKPLHMKIPRW